MRKASALPKIMDCSNLLRKCLQGQNCLAYCVPSGKKFYNFDTFGLKCSSYRQLIINFKKSTSFFKSLFKPITQLSACQESKLLFKKQASLAWAIHKLLSDSS